MINWKMLWDKIIILEVIQTTRIMKKNALLLLLLFSIVMFSQDKNLNYYFNHYEVSITKNYSFPQKTTF